MSWLTKELTLDILAIAIGALVDIHDTIDPTRKTPNTATPQLVEAPTQPAEPQPAEPQPAAAEEPTHTPAPQPTLPEIQNALRTIAQTEGTHWIQNELFTGLGITNITHLPDDKTALAWEQITTHLQEIQQ